MLFPVAFGTLLVLFEIPSSSVMFGVSSGIVEVLISQEGKPRLKERKLVLEGAEQETTFYSLLPL